MYRDPDVNLEQIQCLITCWIQHTSFKLLPNFNVMLNSQQILNTERPNCYSIKFVDNSIIIMSITSTPPSDLSTHVHKPRCKKAERGLRTIKAKV